MRAWKVFSLLLICALILAPNMSASAAKRDLGLETLAPNDGWASFGSGVTGGSAADAEHIYVVHNRQEFVAALYDGQYPPPSVSNPSNTPKIIYVAGEIDANVDDNNQPIGCKDYYRDGFTIEAFIEAYNPEAWGTEEEPSGPIEDARLASRNAQQDRVRIRVGSNTTIVGLGTQGVIRGAWLDLRGSASTPRKNIIIRNLKFQDTYDCFPAWDPTDGENGSWNALYDAISLRNTENVWIDHNTFEDAETADDMLPTVFGVLYQIHDGLLDITNASDYVTVSYNRFQNHDKLMLIGSSDSASADRGRLNVTLHHNYFDNVGQRAPRVRYGKVHLYNNVYKIVNNNHYVYTWGVGKESQIYAENNIFITDQSVTPDKFISVLNGTAIYAANTRVNGAPGGLYTDVVGAYNDANDPDLIPTVDWTPTLFLEIQSVQRALPEVMRKAGPFNW